MLVMRLHNMKSDFVEYDEGTVTSTIDSAGFYNNGSVHSDITAGGEQIINFDIIKPDFTSKNEQSQFRYYLELPIFVDMN